MPSAQAKKHLAQIPGSDSFFELLALNRDPVPFHERYGAHGQVFRTRFVYPVVFLIGAEANRSIMITIAQEIGFGRGYHQTSIRRVFDGSIMLQDGADPPARRASCSRRSTAWRSSRASPRSVSSGRRWRISWRMVNSTIVTTPVSARPTGWRVTP